jgi:predicted alpha-1,6-mannanase (GH76 family)
MPSFQELFVKSAGKPIEYQGKTLVMFDDFPMEGVKRLRLVFEECKNKWHQGVARGFEGKFKVNGQIIRKGMVLWYDTAPQTVELEAIGKISTIEVKNVWDVGDGVIHSWQNGAAMIVDLLPNGRRYRCNDGLADDNFNDIVFRLEHVAAS